MLDVRSNHPGCTNEMEMGICIISPGNTLQILPGNPYPTILDRATDAVQREVVRMESVVSFGCVSRNMRSCICSLAHTQCCEHTFPIQLLPEPANSGRIVPGNAAVARQFIWLPRSIHVPIPVA